MNEERKGSGIMVVGMAWLGRLIAIAIPLTLVLAVIVISTPTGRMSTVLFWATALVGTAYWIAVRLRSHWGNWRSRP